MKKKFHLILMTIAAAGLLVNYSCAPTYVPNVVTTPFLGDKGDVAGSVNYGVSGFDPQFAYAVTDNIGVVANGSYINTANDTNSQFRQHLHVEFGGGYHTRIGSFGRFEAYGGGGVGRINAKFDDLLFVSYEDVLSTRLFIQPSVGFVTDVFEIGFSTRFVLVSLMQDQKSETAPFIEPALTAKLGYSPVKGMMQLGFSLPLNPELKFYFQPVIFSIGLQIRLNTSQF